MGRCGWGKRGFSRGLVGYVRRKDIRGGMGMTPGEVGRWADEMGGR